VKTDNLELAIDECNQLVYINNIGRVDYIVFKISEIKKLVDCLNVIKSFVGYEYENNN
jgi:hypothetical protein